MNNDMDFCNHHLLIADADADADADDGLLQDDDVLLNLFADGHRRWKISGSL